MSDSFIKTGDFFATSGVQRTDVFKLPRRYCSLANTLGWAIVILVPMLYYLVNLLLSGSTVQCLIAIGIISSCEYKQETNDNNKYSLLQIIQRISPRDKFLIV